MRRTLAIGDIHGMIEKLEELLEKIRITKDDTIILLGDYIDRGARSRSVIEKIMELQASGYDLVPLKGNHEEMLLKALAHRNSFEEAFWLENGGRATLASYGMGIPKKHIDFIKNLPLYHETASHFFVHAGVLPGFPPSESDEEVMLWIRGEFVHSSYDWGKKIVFGHTPFAAPALSHNKIGIDTGCVYGGKLTCLILPEETFISV
ncbi:metallophosphoesterase family protein [Desulforhabdus amnigena]|jgi:serine/threonine protein phosphatase 1|uniref:Serine/threonine protein phosphatase n=1 Tax=Desulforhabdus amnigena TaxID=40218 RepID=A0A9W6FUP5_9BACT|nr:metallophosphoesterase family protein [Desulforhabdus amnigena]NLJ29596.1 serine/threonine protein phosphatase [Deltaproteobacteria bacterium]GLI35231.1 serine/threonine protein phosphatase [Desulforhabdus amnigena]